MYFSSNSIPYCLDTTLIARGNIRAKCVSAEKLWTQSSVTMLPTFPFDTAKKYCIYSTFPAVHLLNYISVRYDIRDLNTSGLKHVPSPHRTTQNFAAVRRSLKVRIEFKNRLNLWNKWYLIGLLCEFETDTLTYRIAVYPQIIFLN